MGIDSFWPMIYKEKSTDPFWEGIYSLIKDKAAGKPRSFYFLIFAPTPDILPWDTVL